MVKYRKLKTGDIANNLLERWLTFFDVKTPEETLWEVIRMDSAINAANERINFVSKDKEFLRNYHLREMAMSDWTTGINTATEKGLQKGRAEEKLEIARKMREMGDSIEKIQAITGLPAETIEQV